MRLLDLLETDRELPAPGRTFGPGGGRGETSNKGRNLDGNSGGEGAGAGASGWGFQRPGEAG